MIILQARFGYIYRNKQTGTLHERVCLPNKKRIDDYEEVPREDIDVEVYKKINDLEEANKSIQDTNKILKENNHSLQEQNKSLTKVAKVVANQVTDDETALQLQEFYDEWQMDISVVQGQYIRYEDILYKVLTAHTTQAGWTPKEAASLFAKVLVDPEGETILDWEQPNATNPYMIGNKVIHNGVTYICTVDNNVWEPGVYGWEVVEG